MGISANMSLNDKVSECEPRRMTDFSINSILASRSPRLVDDPSKRISRRPLNKVFESPWASQGPIVFNPTARVQIVGEFQCQSSFEVLPDASMHPTLTPTECDCQMCGKSFNPPTRDNNEKNPKVSKYECEECGKGFSQLRNYKYHISIHRGTKEFAAHCPECGKMFNDKGYLSSHLKIHRNRKEYACPHCPKSFNQRVAFNMHVRIHTGIKPHICNECGKRFSRKMLLKQHSRTHSGEKPYQCTICGKTFADRSNMTLHQRLHSGIKPFSCPICPKAFTKKHHLKTHLNYHTGYKPYHCPHKNCGQSFTQSSNMRTHAKKCQFQPPAEASP
ncbi:zinc finger and BTB domain-containing protein 49 [Sergentomyia squamirostris]